MKNNRRNNIERMTISEQMLKIQESMCDKYCKYPELSKETISDPDEAFEWLQHNYCEDCPLQKLT